MQTSVFLAKLMGPLGLAIGFGMVVNTSAYQALAAEFLHSYAMIYLSGVVTLVVGLAIVNAHNVWTHDWRTIITVIGWLATIGGALRILAPNLVAAVGTAIVSHAAALIGAAIVLVIVGGVLTFKGYSQSFSMWDQHS